MNAAHYLELFFEEKYIPFVQWSLEDSEGVTHFISSEVVVEQILGAPPHEQEQIANVLRRLDFANASILDFLRHLAVALIRNYNGALR